MHKTVINKEEFVNEFKKVMTHYGFGNWYETDSRLYDSRLYTELQNCRIELSFDYVTVAEDDYIIGDNCGNFEFLMTIKTECGETYEHPVYDRFMTKFCNDVIDYYEKLEA